MLQTISSATQALHARAALRGCHLGAGVKNMTVMESQQAPPYMAPGGHGPPMPGMPPVPQPQQQLLRSNSYQ